MLSFGASLIHVADDAVASLGHLTNRDRLMSCSRGVLGGLIGAALLSTVASASPTHALKGVSVNADEAPLAVRPIADGLYFFGAADHPDEIGHAYMVFEADSSNIVGAIFMPQSSFDCFRGQVVGHELALQITNSYTQEVHDYPIALMTDSDPIAMVGTPQLPLQLSGFYDLGAPREAEAQLLTTCQASYTEAEI